MMMMAYDVLLNNLKNKMKDAHNVSCVYEKHSERIHMK